MRRFCLVLALLAATPAFAQTSPQNPLQYYLYQESGGYAPPVLNQAPAPQPEHDPYSTAYSPPQEMHPQPYGYYEQEEDEQINQGVRGMNFY